MFIIKAMLTKQEAVMADIEAYNGVIQCLREQSQECSVSILVFNVERIF